MQGEESALYVRKGVEQPEKVSSEQVRKLKLRRKPELTPEAYLEGILAGNRTVLSRAITLLESTLPAHQDLAQNVIELCLPHAGNSIRAGITGVPGVGKSTFIEALGVHLAAERGEKVAVLAVDPSSRISGGSILGDKTRMEKLSMSMNAFIRPSPSGGSLGGVARKTRESIWLCEAAGYRNVLVETVGVGQSETAVHAMVDCFLLLMLPGAGDELQGIKRGIMEMADLIAINKADGPNRIRAEAARQDYENALHLFPPGPSGWTQRVTVCSAVEDEGITRIWETVLEHHEAMLENGYFQRRRHEQARNSMHETIGYALQDRFHSHPKVRELLPSLERAVLKGHMSAFRAAALLLEAFDKQQS